VCIAASNLRIRTNLNGGISPIAAIIANIAAAIRDFCKVEPNRYHTDVLYSSPIKTRLTAFRHGKKYCVAEEET